MEIYPDHWITQSFNFHQRSASLEFFTDGIFFIHSKLFFFLILTGYINLLFELFLNINLL